MGKVSALNFFNFLETLEDGPLGSRNSAFLLGNLFYSWSASELKLAKILQIFKQNIDNHLFEFFCWIFESNNHRFHEMQKL